MPLPNRSKVLKKILVQGLGPIRLGNGQFEKFYSQTMILKKLLKHDIIDIVLIMLR